MKFDGKIFDSIGLVDRGGKRRENLERHYLRIFETISPLFIPLI